MQPLNPFLAAFFKSPLPSQCSPVQHHILLVPTTDVLLSSRESEAIPGTSVAETVSAEEFLASHVLRIPDPTKPAAGGAGSSTAAGGKDSMPNLREMRGKAKQYNTVNGRNVVIKDNVVYTNKGRWLFRTALRPRRAPCQRQLTPAAEQASRLWLRQISSATQYGTPTHSNPEDGSSTTYHDHWWDHGRRSRSRQQ